MIKKYKKISLIIAIYLFITVIIFVAFNMGESGETTNISLSNPKIELDKTIENNNLNTLTPIVVEQSPDIDITYYQNYYNNKDIIGRLEIPNLFNILITKTNDNKYYLNHSPSKEKSVKGTEFIDYRVDGTSKQVNIYGHNSRTYNTPFRKLESFLDKEYFNNNKYIILQTINNHRVYEITAIKEVQDNEHMKVNLTNQDFINHLDKLTSNAIYKRDISYNENSNILVLQTCSYANKDSYYIIVAIEV